MAKKRNLEMISSMKDDSTIFVDKKEILKLTKVAKSWEFTCSFCFKKFPSAQAMGGHQNAHRSERLEEKRLFVKDPIGYRKRNYLRAMKKEASGITLGSGASNPTLDLHAASDMVKHELANINAPPKILNSSILLPVADFGETKAAGGSSNVKDLGPQTQSSCSKDVKGENLSLVLMNFLPPKELSLAESVGMVHAADEKGKPCVDFDVGGYGFNMEKVDLTLKL